MDLPPISPRGDVLYADFRRWGGPRHVCLDLPAGSPDLEVGIAVGRALESYRALGQIREPELPGLGGKPGLTLADAILAYVDGRDYDRDSSEVYVRGLCRRISRQLGHLSLGDLDGRAGNLILLRWVESLRDGKAHGLKKPLGPHTVQNYLKQLMAVLRDALDAGQVRALPREPRRLGENSGPVYVPQYEHWTEADFRKLREGWGEWVLRMNAWVKFLGHDREVWKDFIAKRNLYLSMAYYTGLHTADLDRVPAEWLSWEVGRYRRENTKSARCVRPAVFDMPEQLQADCAEEARRCHDLGRSWRSRSQPQVERSLRAPPSAG